MHSDAQRLSRRRFLAAAGAAAAVTVASRFAVARPSEDESTLPRPIQTQIDDMTQHMLQEYSAPSAVIGVTRGGSASYVKGYGKTKLPDGDRPDGDTVYSIGSLSKALTAVGLMQLVQKGSVELESPASTYIQGLPTPWRRVTVKQIMCHTSGLPDVTRQEKISAGKIEQIYRDMANTPLTFPPGSKEQYNNFNFDLTGNLIECVAGKPYTDYMKQHVFEPAGMTRSGIGKIDPANSATGYEGGENGIHAVDAEVVPIGTPSGGLESTVNDLLKLGHALCQHRLLNPSVLHQMIAPYSPFNATPGWYARQTPQGPVVFKDGATGGYMSFMIFVPAQGHVAVVLRNLQKLKTPIAPLCNRILHVACGVPLVGEGK